MTKCYAKDQFAYRLIGHLAEIHCVAPPSFQLT